MPSAFGSPHLSRSRLRRSLTRVNGDSRAESRRSLACRRQRGKFTPSSQCERSLCQVRNLRRNDKDSPPVGMTVDRTRLRGWYQVASAGAVVLSLVFVGLQVRESARQTAESARQTELNTQSLQVSAYQELIGRLMDINMMYLQNPEMVPREFANTRSLSPEQLQQLRMLNITRLRFGDLAFYQYELGMLNEERFESAVRPLTNVICNDAFAELWAEMKVNFAESYRNYIDTRSSAC